MRQGVLLDTGSLVAYLKRQDQFHDWAIMELTRIEPPLLTCEAVIRLNPFLYSIIRLPQAPVVQTWG